MTRRLTIEEVVRQPLPGMDAPTAVRFAGDSDLLLYLQHPADSPERALWRHDLTTGERLLLAGPGEASAPLSREEELRRERLRERGGGVTSYQLSDDGRTALVTLAGRLFRSSDRMPVEPILGVDGVQDARLSPDGRRIAYVRAGDVYSFDDEAGPRRLTHDAEPGVTNGLAEYVAAEELDRHVGTWWSADGGALLVAHVDERRVPPYPLPHLAGEQLEIEEHRYPFAGGPNARVSLRLIELGDGVRHGEPRNLDLGMADDEYLARVVPDPRGGWLVAVLPRAQRSLRWVRIGADGAVRGLWTEESEPWLNLDNATRVLRDGRVVRSTERSGWRHLELRDPDGGFERQLTAGEWVVTELVQVVERRPGEADLYFIGTRDGVLERHLYRVGLEGGEPERLTSEPGWHAAAVRSDGGAWVDTWSSLEHAPAVAVRFTHPAEGTITIHAPSATAASLELPAPRLWELCAADGTTTLHAALYQPADGTPESQPAPPAVVWVYGGPHSQKVANEWSLTVELHRQMLRQLGFAVIVVDNRGTSFRGRAFEAALAGQLGEVEIADQAAAVRQLAAERLLDVERVGITGGSYGGYLTLMALLREPELFRCGVAGAPVIDWHLYDTAYTERYLGRPEENPSGYAASSVLHGVAQLDRPVLVVHGLVDENVHFRHTARLLGALAEADRDVELLLFPEERHGERHPAARRQRQRRALAFFCRQLGRPLPPELRTDA
jgi:dipeptidyl-peptidase-4